MDYKDKYLKYKNKYLELKQQIGGSEIPRLPQDVLREIYSFTNYKDVIKNNSSNSKEKISLLNHFCLIFF